MAAEGAGETKAAWLTAELREAAPDVFFILECIGDLARFRMLRRKLRAEGYDARLLSGTGEARRNGVVVCCKRGRTRIVRLERVAERTLGVTVLHSGEREERHRIDPFKEGAVWLLQWCAALRLGHGSRKVWTWFRRHRTTTIRVLASTSRRASRPRIQWRTRLVRAQAAGQWSRRARSPPTSSNVAAILGAETRRSRVARHGSRLGSTQSSVRPSATTPTGPRA